MWEKNEALWDSLRMAKMFRAIVFVFRSLIGFFSELAPCFSRSQQESKLPFPVAVLNIETVLS